MNNQTNEDQKEDQNPSCKACAKPLHQENTLEAQRLGLPNTYCDNCYLFMKEQAHGRLLDA